jgi:hypothetical protein
MQCLKSKPELAGTPAMTRLAKAENLPENANKADQSRPRFHPVYR